MSHLGNMTNNQVKLAAPSQDKLSELFSSINNKKKRE